MMEILSHVTVHVDCAICPDGYDIPASLIAESRALLEHGCPGTSALECAPAFYASLAEPAELEELARTWLDAHDLALAVSRWEDDGGPCPDRSPDEPAARPRSYIRVREQ